LRRRPAGSAVRPALVLLAVAAAALALAEALVALAGPVEPAGTARCTRSWAAP